MNALGRVHDHAAHRQPAHLSPASRDRRVANIKQNRTTQQAAHATTASQATDSKTAQQSSQLPAFDWRNQWYPVHFARDLPVGRPQRVYMFDEPIVLLKRPGEQGVVALRDRCPHRAAALSEGRMTPDGQLQCAHHSCYILTRCVYHSCHILTSCMCCTGAYHGWSFDGDSGICTNIPQVRH